MVVKEQEGLVRSNIDEEEAFSFDPNQPAFEFVQEPNGKKKKNIK